MLMSLCSLGLNEWVMSALYSFMLDRVTAGDLDSTLVTSILKVQNNVSVPFRPFLLIVQSLP